MNVSGGTSNYSNETDVINFEKLWEVAEKNNYPKYKCLEYNEYLLKHFSEETLYDLKHNYFYYTESYIIINTILHYNEYRFKNSIMYAYAPQFIKDIIYKKIKEL